MPVQESEAPPPRLAHAGIAAASPPPLVYAGMAAAAGAVLLLEIGLTRIFSYTIWCHFTYLTISVALLGYDVSGSLLAAWPALRERPGFLSWTAVAAQLAVLLCLLVIDRVPLDPLAIASDPGQFGRLLLYYGAVVAPFFAGGFLVAAPLQEWPRQVGRLYFWDLLGAGAACGAIVPLVWWLGTPVATSLATAALGVAAFAYAEPHIRWRQGALAALAAAGTVAFAAGAEFTPAPTKFVSRFLDNPGSHIAYHRWTPINRVDVVAEGRSFLRSRHERYDLVEINSVDTLSALSTGAYVLSESFLYTKDAVEDYLDHLAPDGIFAMAVGDIMSETQPPRHTLRLASIVRRALEDRGVDDPGRHVIIVGTRGGLPFTHTLVKNEPFRADEIETVARFVAAEGFHFWHRPDAPGASQASRILSWDPATLEAFYESHPLDLRPTTDTSPFFFNFYKWRTLAREAAWSSLGYDRTLATGQIVLVVMLVQSVVFSALLIVLPLRFVPRPARGDGGHRLGFLLYFAALGAGFILLEISFIQRFVLFLGYPTYSLTVVMLALLVSTGVGSLLTARVQSDFARRLPRRLILLVALAGGMLLLAPRIFDALLGAPLALRIAVAIAMLVPLGIVLGGFFPLGIRMVERANPRLVPWAWAVNGCATVVGTLLAVMAGMTWSFTAVALLAIAIYAGGVAAVRFAGRSGAA